MSSPSTPLTPPTPQSTPSSAVIMEHVFFRAHSQASFYTIRHSTPRIRSLVEHVVLLCAVGIFAIVLVTHYTFVATSNSSSSGGVSIGIQSQVSYYQDRIRYDHNDKTLNEEEIRRTCQHCYQGQRTIMDNTNTRIQNRESDNTNNDPFIIKNEQDTHQEDPISLLAPIMGMAIPSNCLLNINGFDEHDVDVTNIYLRYHVDGEEWERHHDRWNTVGKRSFVLQPSQLQQQQKKGQGQHQIDSSSCGQSSQDESKEPHSCRKPNNSNNNDCSYTENNESFSFVASRCTNDQHVHWLPPTIHSEQQNQENQKRMPTDVLLYSYSQIKGYLLLNDTIRFKHNIPTQEVIVSVKDSMCFGDTFLQYIIQHVMGPDTVILNWLLALHGGDGYMYNPRNGKLLDLHYASNFLPRRGRGGIGCGNNVECNNYTNGIKNTRNTTSSKKLLLWLTSSPWIMLPIRFFRIIAFKACIVVASLFLFFVTTTLVSFTLRETQERMLVFTFLLRNHIRQGLPYARLVFKHVVESLAFVPITVGMLFFLIEIYHGDRILAILVLSVVWVCEIFSVMGMRTRASIQFFPRVYFLFFCLFHAYFFSCPFGFSYTALASTVLFLSHSMLFFWNRYEIPALQCGVISHSVLRQNMYFPPLPPPAQVEQRAERGAPMPVSQPDPIIVPIDNAANLRRVVPRSPSLANSLPSTSTLARASSQGRLSRVTSDGSVLFIEGDEGEDDAYVTFMNGEVVMHRSDPAHARRSMSPNQHFYPPLREATTSEAEDSDEQGREISIARQAINSVQGPATQAATAAADIPFQAAIGEGTARSVMRQASGEVNASTRQESGSDSSMESPQAFSAYATTSLGDLLLATSSSNESPGQCFYR